MNISKKSLFFKLKRTNLILNILNYIDENFKYKLVKYSKKYQNILKINLSDYKKNILKKNLQN